MDEGTRTRISIARLRVGTKSRKQIGRIWWKSAADPPANPRMSVMRGDENAIPDAIITRAPIDSRRSLPYKYFLGVDGVGRYLVCTGDSGGKRASIIGFQIIRRPVLHVSVACARAPQFSSMIRK